MPLNSRGNIIMQSVHSARFLSPSWLTRPYNKNEEWNSEKLTSIIHIYISFCWNVIQIDLTLPQLGEQNELYITYTDFTWQIRGNNTYYEALKMHFWNRYKPGGHPHWWNVKAWNPQEIHSWICKGISLKQMLVNINVQRNCGCLALCG